MYVIYGQRGNTSMALLTRHNPHFSEINIPCKPSYLYGSPPSVSGLAWSATAILGRYNDDNNAGEACHCLITSTVYGGIIAIECQQCSLAKLPVTTIEIMAHATQTHTHTRTHSHCCLSGLGPPYRQTMKASAIIWFMICRWWHYIRFRVSTMYRCTHTRANGNPTMMNSIQGEDSQKINITGG